MMDETTIRESLLAMGVPARFLELGDVSYIAHGSTCEVFWIRGERDYALKVIDCKYSDQKFENACYEIRLMKRLSKCTRTVRMIDSEIVVGRGCRLVCILEEYCTPLSEYLKMKPLSYSERVRMLLELCDALIQCRNAGVLHLDIQHGNLFVDDEGGIKLGDFGASLFIADLHKHDKARGTMAYMAPEVYRRGAVGELSDIYSVGMLLYRLMEVKRNRSFRKKDDSDVLNRLHGAEIPPVAVDDLVLQKAVMRVVRRACAFSRMLRIKRFEVMKRELEWLYNEIIEKNLDDPAQMVVLIDPVVITTVMSVVHTVAPGSGSGWRPGSGHWQIDQGFVTEDHMPLPGIPDGHGSSDSEREFAVTFPMVDSDNDGVFDEIVPGAMPIPPSSNGGSFLPPPPPPSPSPVQPSSNGGSFPPPPPPSPRPMPPSSNGEFLSPVPPRPSPRPMPLGPKCKHCGLPLNPMDKFCSQCGAPTERMKSSVDIYRVAFSAVAPKSFVKNEHSPIDIIMYEPDYRSIVNEIKAELGENGQEKRGSMMKVAEDARVRICLCAEGLDIQEDTQEQIWAGGYLVFQFFVRVPQTYAGKEVFFRANVYVDGIRVSSMTFTAKCEASMVQELRIIRSDVRTAFVSYARRDKEKVLRVVQGMKRICPNANIFLDLDQLDTGDDWARVLYREIEERDVFYLCWSRNAKASEWVEREWRHAYETRGEGIIEPIALEHAKYCPPPEELKHKHFDDRMLYFGDDAREDPEPPPSHECITIGI